MSVPHSLPSANDRVWNTVDPKITATVISGATQHHATPAVMPTAAEWMQFRLSGNRINYENRLTALHDRMSTSTLAACLAQEAEEKSRWSSIAADDAWALCELTSWCLPAHHNGGKVDTSRELPALSDPVLDLEAGVTGALLAWAGSLLEDQWRVSSPTILERIHDEIRQRVMIPFTHQTHWWFGSLESPPNNWAPWITANAMACFRLVGTPEEQDAASPIAGQVLENFCAGYSLDGACEEGATYWWHAAVTLFEALNFVGPLADKETDKRITSLLAAMGKYPYQMQVHERWQVNFGDASPHIDTEMRFHTALRYATAVGDEDAALYARSMGTLAGQTDPSSWKIPEPTGRNFHRMVLELLDPDWITTAASSDQSMPYPATTFLPSTGVLCARQNAGSSQGLFLSVKGGHNGVSHNHNDAGTITVFASGKPVIIDVGVETYRKETFDNSKRYDIWTMRSSFHNVPCINGQEQLHGRGHAATELVSWGAENTLDTAERTGLSMNLEQAYGEVDGVSSWTRSAQLDRVAEQIRVDDSWEGSDVDAEIVLMLAEAPNSLAANSFEVAGARIAYSPGWEATFEEIAVEDARLIPVWGTAVHRAVIRPESNGPAGNKHQLTVTEA